jgi:methionine-rich copper-binding protein CopC
MRALPLDRWPAHALTRGLLIFLGTSGLLTGTCDALRPRARLVASDPVAGTTLATPPALVTLTFTEALDPSSNVNVARTVTVLPTGEELATGGTPVADATGAAALSADGRSLRVRLPPNPPGGLYAVQWAAVRAGNRTERFGHLYFGAGMPVPDHIVRDGVLQERDADPYDRKSAIGGGILLIGLGLALPLLVKRSWTTGTAPW